MINFDKNEIRENLEIDNIYELLVEWGGEPEYTDYGILSATICHNPPGEGSRKLYYYSNSDLFNCYSGCGESFDIFQLVIKVFEIQYNKQFDLNDAVRWIAYKFGISGTKEDNNEEDILTEDWNVLNNYERLQEIEIKNYNVILKEYDKTILQRLNYKVKIAPWLNEGISQKVLEIANIGFYPGGDQITIPHYDKDGRFVGLRGRSLCAAEAERYGKYRPVVIEKTTYNHPLGMNLYNLNHSKDNIKIMKKAIVWEAEKSCLLYKTYFGEENDISVACCGSNLSMYQVNMLLEAGAQEIIIAFDRQFQEIGDNEFKLLVKKLTKIHNKYKNYATISFIFDKKKITSYKASPIDEGKDKFIELFKERIIL